MTARLLSMQIGKIQQLGRPDATDPHDRPWTTAFFKTPVMGPCEVNREGLAGDESADREHHGTLEKAVLFYAAEHYPRWQAEYNLPEMPFGGFGENFTVSELDESNVCIGDSWSLGETVLQVSQPRQPCWKLARRWSMKELPALVNKHHRSGWYCRVVQTGLVNVQQEVKLLARPNPDWSIARASDVMYQAKHDAALSHALAALPELAESWREELLQR